MGFDIGAEVAARGLAAAIERFVGERDWVTFAEIDRHFAAFARVRGDGLELHAHDKTNCVLWVDLSAEFSGAMTELLGGGRLVMFPASPLSYLIDGAAPSLPLAKSARAYAKPRWFPVTMRTPAQVASSGSKQKGRA